MIYLVIINAPLCAVEQETTRFLRQYLIGGIWLDLLKKNGV